MSADNSIRPRRLREWENLFFPKQHLGKTGMTEMFFSRWRRKSAGFGL